MGNNAADLGDGFAMPTAQTPDEMLETAIARLTRGEPGMRLRSIAMRSDCRLDVAELWALLRINRYQQALGIARLTDIGEQLGIPYEVLEPTFDRLVRGGYARRDVDRLWLTPSGARQVDFVSSLLQGWIIDKLTRSGNFEGRLDRPQVEAALNRITHGSSHNRTGTTISLSCPNSRPRKSHSGLCGNSRTHCCAEIRRARANSGNRQ